MAITFHPKAGMVLSCDFRGGVAPELTGIRPVVVVSPNHLRRAGLVGVVPLSTTRPNPVEAFHCRLSRHAVFGSEYEIWAKCDLVMSVAVARLDRIRLPQARYVVGRVSIHELLELRTAAARSFGIDAGRRGH
jgi:uncharacterized protein YifN (PemK superfamily)